MLGSFVEALQHGTCDRRDVSNLVVLSCERFNVLQRVEPHYGNEFNFIIDFAPQNLYQPVAVDVHCSDARDNFGSEQIGIYFRILGRRITVPDATNHVLLPSKRPKVIVRKESPVKDPVEDPVADPEF